MPSDKLSPQIPLRAVFMRGGTSRALVFRAEDLPQAGSTRDSMILAAMGSPDPNKRQLDGMGAGTSSTSKIAIIAKSSREDADIDYTFGQVSIDASVISYKGNCGNISSAVGPYAVEEGLVKTTGDQAIVRIHNTNTGKIIVATFALQDSLPMVDGDFALDGVGGTHAPIALSFLEPGGSSTGKTLPTGKASELLETDGFGAIEVSLIDVSNPIACVRASNLGLTGRESPAGITETPDLLNKIETIRIAAAVRMGICSREEAQTSVRNLPQIAIVSAPTDQDSPDANLDANHGANIVLRMISTGQAHASSPITGGMCLAATMRLTGSVAHQIARHNSATDQPLTIAHPSGTLVLDADITGTTADDFTVNSVTVFRSARRLMQGEVMIPRHRITGDA
ncbi:PrpF family protein [Thalassospira sp. GO-4]|uniref:2-methylaconitate cis-trans isomerase PrpF family protein n=1 Tax=Thalassospira sp. GO-4 TaxID=2946605 RepID=UPI0020259B92|nr:PrpF domain-containing protein [Thalassospira sp. GO-4]URK16993.1 PrpF family protein [Thalassospira sp. GO-4]